MTKEVFAGIDIGGTTTQIGIVDSSGQILGRSILTTPDYSDESLFAHDIWKSMCKLQENNPFPVTVAGIGIGAPNGNYFTGCIESAPNLNFKDHVPLVELIRDESGIEKIYLTNDANAAALGEMVFGNARNIKDFLFITLGTGLGSGIVVNGSLLYGHDGFAGELGHVIVEDGGRVCGCGRNGCLETYVSAPGICRTTLELMAYEKTKSVLRQYPVEKLDSHIIYEAAKSGDPLALQAFDVTGEILGKALANAVALFSPEAVFLFGGLANAGDLLFEPVQIYMEENMLNIFRNKVKLLSSGLPHSDAAILGAVALVKENMKL